MAQQETTLVDVVQHVKVCVFMGIYEKLKRAMVATMRRFRNFSL